MLNWTEVITVPVITTIVYGVCAIYKKFVTNENWIRLIPLVAIVVGAILGVVAYYVSPTIMPAADLLTALFIGAASGAAATGLNQVVKQQNQTNTKIEDVDDNNKKE